MVQLPKALRECHWDAVEGADGPSYLLHRNDGVVYYGSHEWREAQYWHELRPRAAKRASRRRGQALAMSNDELAQLEKTDPTLARGVENPDERALLQLFLSSPTTRWSGSWRRGLFSMNVEDAPASWKTVLEHELARKYDGAVADGSDPSLWKDAQARLSQSTVGFEHGGGDGIRIRIAGNITSPVLWTRYPRLMAMAMPPGHEDMGDLPLLRKPGEGPKAEDALLAEWAEGGEKAKAEQADQPLLATRPGPRGLEGLDHPRAGGPARVSRGRAGALRPDRVLGHFGLLHGPPP